MESQMQGSLHDKVRSGYTESWAKTCAIDIGGLPCEPDTVLEPEALLSLRCLYIISHAHVSIIDR